MTYAPGDTLRIPVTGDTLTALDGTTSPYGLYRNGSRDAAVTVTVTGAGGDWLATLTIPSGYSLGDTVWLKLLATTADETYVVTSEPIVLADVQAAAAAAIAAAGLATEDKQDEILAAIASAGVGARTCVITVDDGTDLLEGARVRVTKGAESWSQPTGVSGQATFNLDDGSWTVAITLAGYTFSGDTLVVDGDEAETFSMTAAGFTPSVEPDSVTVRWRVKGKDRATVGAGEATVYVAVQDGPGTAGEIWSGNEDSDTTDANGYVEFTNVPIPCTLLVRAGADGVAREVAIPATATSPYDAGELTNQDVD